MSKISVVFPELVYTIFLFVNFGTKKSLINAYAYPSSIYVLRSESQGILHSQFIRMTQAEKFKIADERTHQSQTQIYDMI